MVGQKNQRILKITRCGEAIATILLKGMPISQNRFPLQEGDLLPLSDIMERWWKSWWILWVRPKHMEHDAIMFLCVNAKIKRTQKEMLHLIDRWTTEISRNLEKNHLGFFNANYARWSDVTSGAGQKCEDLTPEVVRADTPLLRSRVVVQKDEPLSWRKMFPMEIPR